MSCAIYRRSWTVEQVKEIEIGCEKGQCNTNKEKEVTTEQESMRDQSQKIPLSLYII
jgi:hypothetical protein